MKTDVGALKAVGLVTGDAPRPADKARPSAGQPAAPVDLAAVRLVIEEDRQSGSFIYKTLDRVTGEVLSQFPREDVLKMLTRGSYAAGDVVKTRA